MLASGGDFATAHCWDVRAPRGCLAAFHHHRGSAAAVGSVEADDAFVSDSRSSSSSSSSSEHCRRGDVVSEVCWMPSEPSLLLTAAVFQGLSAAAARGDAVAEAAAASAVAGDGEVAGGEADRAAAEVAPEKAAKVDPKWSEMLLWDLAKLEEGSGVLLAHRNHERSEVYDVSVSADGLFVASVDTANRLEVWRIADELL